MKTPQQYANLKFLEYKKFIARKKVSKISPGRARFTPMDTTRKLNAS